MSELRAVIKEKYPEWSYYIVHLSKGKASVVSLQPFDEVLKNLDPLSINDAAVEITELELSFKPPVGRYGSGPVKSRPRLGAGYLVEFSPLGSSAEADDIEECVADLGFKCKVLKSMNTKKGKMCTLKLFDKCPSKQLVEKLETLRLNDLHVGRILIQKTKIIVKLELVSSIIKIDNIPDDTKPEKLKAAIKKRINHQVRIMPIEEGKTEVKIQPLVANIEKKLSGLSIQDQQLGVFVQDPNNNPTESPNETLKVPDNCKTSELMKLLKVHKIDGIQFAKGEVNLKFHITKEKTLKNIEEKVKNLVDEAATKNKKSEAKTTTGGKEVDVKAVAADKTADENVDESNESVVKSPQNVQYGSTDIRERRKAKKVKSPTN